MRTREFFGRAEYALGKAIRKGQEEGTIRTRGEGSRDSLQPPSVKKKLPPSTFATYAELYGNYERGGRLVRVPGREATGKSSPNDFFAHATEKVESYALADVTEDEFEDAPIKVPSTL